MMKRFLALLMCACLLAGLAGCKTQAEDVEKEAEETAKNTYRVYTPDEENIVFDETEQITYVNNMLMVVFDEDASKDDVASLVESVEGKVIETVPSIRQYQIQIPERDLQGLAELVARVEQNDCVLFAHYDEVYESPENADMPADPWDGDVNENDWTDEDIDGSNWWMELIDVPGAWEYSEYFSKIKIGVLDTGFDTKHEDLDLKLLGGAKGQGKDHGTHVAGIIGAKHNKKGISGIVKKSELICVDCLSAINWQTDSNVYVGLAAVVEAGAKVVNMSMGDKGDGSCADWIVAQRARKASGYMGELLHEHDFIVVQSAGNDGRDALNNNFFASVTPENCVKYGSGRSSAEDICSRILVVANISSQLNKSQSYFLAPGSNYGTQVDIAAPGGVNRLDANGNTVVDIDKGVYSTVSKNQYALSAGTSMAAPMVSGVAALVWSVSDRFTGSQVADIVCSNTVGTINGDQYNGSYGLLNARAAVEEAVRLVNGEERIETGETVEADTDGVQYEIVRWDASAHDASGASTENCYYEYLRILGDSPAYQKINDVLYSRAERYMSASSGEELAALDPIGDCYKNAWTSVTYNKNSILGITVTADEYTGGNTSHGYFSHYFYDVNTGEEATLPVLTGMEEEELLPLLRQIAWEGLQEQLGDALFPGVEERVANMQLEEFKYFVRDGEIFIEFEQYDVAAGAFGETVIPTGLYLPE